ncbi:MAG: MinD/ParA family protein [Firmicutes bacterium]|nr:MinD/ParA family protein [Bacillota bacterium]
MKDQAEKLREIFKNLDYNKIKENTYGRSSKKSARVITITSGKGGVGKTNLAINLGIKLSQLGLKIIIIDADLGLSNIDIVLGKSPKYSLSDVINYKRDMLEIIEEGPEGIRFISGGSGIQDLIKIDKNQLANLLLQLSKLDEEADIVFIDTGAGVSNNVLSFIYAAKEIILVTTPEPTAITDAYTLIKVISQKDKSKEVKLLINRAESVREAENLLNKLVEASEKFLDMKVYKLGFILNDKNVKNAVKSQQPFVLMNKNSEASKNISSIADTLLSNYYEEQGAQDGIKLFINKLKWFFN